MTSSPGSASYINPVPFHRPFALVWPVSQVLTIESSTSLVRRRRVDTSGDILIMLFVTEALCLCVLCVRVVSVFVDIAELHHLLNIPMWHFAFRLFLLVWWLLQAHLLFFLSFLHSLCQFFVQLTAPAYFQLHKPFNYQNVQLFNDMMTISRSFSTF